MTDRDICEIPKATHSKSGVADRMVTWPMISGGHVTYFLETRSRCSTKMWCISVADGDIGKIPKATTTTTTFEGWTSSDEVGTSAARSGSPENMVVAVLFATLAHMHIKFQVVPVSWPTSPLSRVEHRRTKLELVPIGRAAPRAWS